MGVISRYIKPIIIIIPRPNPNNSSQTWTFSFELNPITAQSIFYDDWQIDWIFTVWTLIFEEIVFHDIGAVVGKISVVLPK